jgi:hypothetical protein
MEAKGCELEELITKPKSSQVLYYQTLVLIVFDCKAGIAEDVSNIKKNRCRKARVE